MTKTYDAAIIGGGHNGLVAAFYLARTGRSVVVLERRSIVGGACVTETFHPGFRNSSLSFVMSYLRPEIIKDMALEERGLEATMMRGGFFPFPDGRYLLSTGDSDHDRAEIAKFSNHDTAGLDRLDAVLTPLADFLAKQMTKIPPKLASGGLGAALDWARMGLDVKGLDENLRHRLMLILTESATGFLSRYLESDEAKLGYVLGVTSGFLVDVDAPATALRLIQSRVGQFDGVRGAWGLPMGGMGAITQAMAEAAEAKGVEIRTGTSVAKVVVEGGRAVGVRLDNGDVIRSRTVLSNADPKRSFLDLVDKANLDPEFRADMAAYKTGGGGFRMNVALSELPDFTCLSGKKEPGPQHSGTIHICPSLDYIRAAYDDARRGDWAREPIIDAMIPSLYDDSLAPPGKHVMMMNCRFHPRDLSGGRSWHDVKHQAAEALIDTMTRYAPNFRDAVLGYNALSPLDLEEEYGLTGGDGFHGQYHLSQMFHLRPHPRASGHRTPLAGYYLCGSGAHPGGGVSGIPGSNAAKVVLRDL
ncbi:MAG: NAD(P)/FAD-dependent oxidoreductase [Alphaproteobacteria bacterium]